VLSDDFHGMSANSGRTTSGGTSSGSGCAPLAGVVFAAFVAIRFWYVALGVIAVLLLVYAVARRKRAKQARRRPGRFDAWLNEVNVASADLGLSEYSRNQLSTVAGVPACGDVTLRHRRFEVRIALFPDARRAHEAEIALRANEGTRDAVRRGKRMLVTRDRVVFDASGRSSAVDEFLLDEVVRVVDRLPVSGPRLVGVGAAATAVHPEPRGDMLRQIRELAALRDAGTITEAEFNENKTSLLKRL
jgi:hypothetical protein